MIDSYFRPNPHMQEKLAFFFFVGMFFAIILSSPVFLIVTNGPTQWIKMYSSEWEKTTGLKLPYFGSSLTIRWICELSVTVQLVHWILLGWTTSMGTSYFVLFIFYKMASEVSITLKQNPNLSLEEVTQ
jgi:uncharacterized BrkB/YihY/UPF0761 family membrane protein